MQNPEPGSYPDDIPPPDKPPPEDKPRLARRQGTAALPDGHRLPAGYELRADGLFLMVPQTDKSGQPLDPKPVRVSYGLLAVAGMYASAEGEQWFDLMWLDGTRPVVRRVDGSTLRSGRALIRECGNAGIPLFEGDARQAERYFAAYLMTNSDAIRAATVRIARHLGWQADGTFVTADAAPWPVEPGQAEQTPILAAFRPAGTLAAWKKVAAHAKGYPVVRVALAASFAAPLLVPLKLRSATLDISGRSTRGKSTAAALALSVWADPSAHSQGMGTWKAGIIMIEKRLNLVRGLPTVLDETRVVKHPDVVDQVLYQVPMDQGAARGGGWASGLPWNTVLISTGEQPALSFTSHEGAAARVLSLRRPPFGLGGERSAHDALVVTEGVGEQHGTAGPAFITRLTAMLAEPDGTSRLRKRHQVLADAHAEAAGNDVARRRAPHVAALHLAAELAYEWDIVPFEALHGEEWTELLADETVREDRGGMALEVVRGLVAAHAHRIQPLNAVAGDTRFIPPPGGWIGAYVDHDDRPAVALLPAAIAQALAAASPPIVLDAVREAWAETGTIVMDGRRLAREHVNGRQVRAYVFPLSVLDEDDTARAPRQQEASPAHPHGPHEQAAPAGWPAGTIGADANP